MKTFILIGGIGSGKSSVAALLRNHGAAVVDLDMLGHACLNDPTIQAALVDAFGADICGDDGAINRSILARYVFSDARSTKTLNEITHPAIAFAAQEKLDRFANNGCAVVVVEASAYTGPGSHIDCLVDNADGIIAVSAPDDVRLARAVAAGFTESDARLRMQRQPSDIQREAWADYVIVNDGTLADLEWRVAELWDWLLGSVAEI